MSHSVSNLVAKDFSSDLLIFILAFGSDLTTLSELLDVDLLLIC